MRVGRARGVRALVPRAGEYARGWCACAGAGQVRAGFEEWAKEHGGDVGDALPAFMEERVVAAAAAIFRAKELAAQKARARAPRPEGCGRRG